MTSSDEQVTSARQQLQWFFSQSPLLGQSVGLRSDDTSITIHVMTPISSPMKTGVATTMHNNKSYFEEVGHVTNNNVVDPQEEWLPITESRNGNAFYAAFHTISSGIGFQALMLPLAFISLGWIWGITCLSLGFIWQLYTTWLLIQLHESENGTRYSRYLRLSIAAFGEKLGKLLSLFPIMYLSGGTCVALIMFGSGTIKIFYQTVCMPNCNKANPLTTVEWYMVFTSCAVILAQLPNLNSISKVSFIGSLTSVGYCTLIWVISVCKDRPTSVSYGPTHVKSDVDRVCGVINAIGMIAFAFRGHNLVLEIQGTMPSSVKQPSRIAMWRGVKFAYLIIGLCLFPVAFGGYWAYGNLIIPTNEGLIKVMYEYHGHDTSKFLLCLTSLLIVIHCLSSFQIYAMPVFDNLEFRFTSSKKKPCPRWLRSGIRAFFGCLTVFIAFTIPFLPSLAGLLGGLALPLTLAYPCFMWIKIKKPREFGFMWYLNWGLGCFGILLSILIVAGAIWSIVIKGMPVHFFKPDKR
ncbi:lysine histidine transporter-like 8 [Chenopodium quinoa]|uniref:Amino acid transporter transmembrane domain-containing protein n=1 Tax=Chenopodium quinoa TaxID=63459 RepID=A0A803LIN0_CHEQI|nr:lysine histidine transporter-like 8 [Chenopodium quinoa]